MKTFPSVTFFIKIQEIIFKSKVGNYQDLTDLFIYIYCIKMQTMHIYLVLIASQTKDIIYK